MVEDMYCVASLPALASYEVTERNAINRSGTRAGQQRCGRATLRTGCAKERGTHGGRAGARQKAEQNAPKGSLNCRKQLGRPTHWHS